MLEDKEIPYDSELFNFKIKQINNSDNKQQNDIKNYLAPIIMFYINFFKEIKDYKEIDNNFLDQFHMNSKEAVLNNKKIEYIFNKRIPKNKACIVIKNFNNKDYIFNDSFAFKDLYYIINSKLFFGFEKLLSTEEKKNLEKNENKIDSEKWNKIIKKINDHIKIELELIKKYFKFDSSKNSKNKNIRNFLLHRSIHEFKDINEYNDAINLEKKSKFNF